MQCIGKREVEKRKKKKEVLESHLYKKLQLPKLLEWKHKEKQIVLAFCHLLSKPQIAFISRELLSPVKTYSIFKYSLSKKEKKKSNKRKIVCIFFSY